MAAVEKVSINQSSSNGISESDATAPEANRRESPGRNGRTTSPVSQKTIENSKGYVHS